MKWILTHPVRTMLLGMVLLSALTACTTTPPPKRVVPSVKNDIGAYHPATYNSAYSYFKAGAERGDPVAQNNLGKMYADGRGVPQDLQKSVYCFNKAAQHGETDAQLNLGVAYLYGHGTGKDITQACHWFKAAKQKGNKFAAEFYAANC